MKTHEEAMEIFKKFGIEAIEIEPSVYKVLNNTEDVNITDLEWELTECLMLVSEKTGSEKDSEGYWNEFAHVYYILLDYDNDDLLDKYEKISKKERKTIVDSFKYNPNYVEEIPTLYDLDEIKWMEERNSQEKKEN